MTSGVPAKRWRYVIPMAVVIYIMAYVDRINVAMILPYVDKSFGLTAAASGFAAGIFFVGYMLLQVAGGYLASRWSARKTIAILMVLWGCTAVLTGFVENRTQLYIARFVLGVFEGGVWPAILALLATWFPQNERARANSLWITCLPISAVLMAPLTGWLLTFLPWRTVFILQGLPPLVGVIVWWFVMADKPSEAKWISPEERAYIEQRLAVENAAKGPSSGFLAAISDRTVLSLTVAYFFWMAGFYGFTMWVPAVVKSFSHGASPLQVGMISAIPFICALVGMVINANWSDRVMKRQPFIAIPVLIGAFGLIAGQMVHAPGLQLLFLAVAAVGVYSPYGPFWAVPSAILRSEISGAAMGFINMGNLGGFLGPFAVGYVRSQTGNGFAGFLLLSVSLFIVAGVILMIGGDRRAAQLRAKENKPTFVPAEALASSGD
jgi:MFS family permease